MAAGRSGHPRLDRGSQRALFGKPDIVPPPQSTIIPLGDLRQRVILPGVRIAAQIRQGVQFAEDRHPCLTPQRRLKFRQGRPFLFLEKTLQEAGREGFGSHNETIMLYYD